MNRRRRQVIKFDAYLLCGLLFAAQVLAAVHLPAHTLYNSPQHPSLYSQDETGLPADKLAHSKANLIKNCTLCPAADALEYGITGVFVRSTTAPCPTQSVAHIDNGKYTAAFTAFSPRAPPTLS